MIKRLLSALLAASMLLGLCCMPGYAEELQLERQKSTADELKEGVVRYYPEEGRVVFTAADYNKILTSEDSPLTVTEVAYFGHVVYFLENNSEVVREQSSYLVEDGDKPTAALCFRAPVEDCVAIVGIKTTVYAVDKEEASSCDWISAAYDGREPAGWMAIGAYDYVDGAEVEANYIEDMLSDNGLELHAYVVSSTDGQKLFTGSEFYIVYNVDEMALVVGSEEAARNYMINVGLEEYLW